MRLTLTLIHMDAACAVYDDFLARLPRLEQQRAGNMVRAEDQCRHVVARAALRMLLGRELGVAADAVALTTQGRGKPVLNPAVHAGEAGSLHFNVTHAGEWAGIALASHAVGIDIEQARPLNYAALSAQIFDAGICRDLAGHPDPQAYFFQQWCAAEARWKAHGIGLAGADATQARAQDDAGAHVLEFAVAPDYYGAVCVLGLAPSERPAHIAATPWQASDLLNELND